jgi:spore germination protein KB
LLLFYQYPGQSPTGYLKNIAGKYIGIPLSLIYIVYFIYIAARVLRDFGALLITSTLSETRIEVVNGLMILLITFGVYLGIEVIGRTGESVFSMMLFLESL